MAKALVDDPSSVSVTETDDGRQQVLELRVGEGDMGKVIGKQGRTAQALRTIVKVASERRKRAAVLEITE